MTQFTRTEVTATQKELTKLFGEGPTGDCVQVCEGEWRKEDGAWRFYKLNDL